MPVDDGQYGTRSDAASPLLEAVGIYRRFGGLRALQGASIAVQPGTITGLIGPNGAGKSTLFNIIAGALSPDQGTVRLRGRDVTHERPDRRAAHGLIRTFQLSRTLPTLSVLENLMLYGPKQPGESVWAALRGSAAAVDRERDLRKSAWRIAEMLKLGHLVNAAAADLSGGQKKLLDLGRVLMAQPRLILLDEPMAGVNPSLSRDLSEHLLQIRAAGITVLVIEHNMSFVKSVCDYVYVLAGGRNLAEGRFESIRAHHGVQQAYLGSDA
ncbi:ABC transporter ATP-binding protein [Bosea sp. (in: a-proteobacteria)]|uniref:ABC transporter ATP-binding protein n=1 Tax=Bosea sp. (in: a-proteobacteria) TaxID=1871050 RepID=UPI00261EBC1E|nr:ABC transporter ATP-binding protein [Bosea sp. (in: a-proteobacteria)]MCO5091327.1 ABC transporter ATP-binding protein [Bosea sp. (in: a-proteobacteria)]